MATLTVFTPLYNRKNTLRRTYESMKNQTCKDFVWMIVDDGSTDNPYDEIKQWIEETDDFEIRYIYKENGGMHTAHNTAYDNIDTELNVCIDSDDFMPNDAVELIINCWEKNKDKGYAGIIGLDCDSVHNKVIGKELPKDKESTTLQGYYNSGGFGDKKLIYRTDIIKNTPPYPVFGNEKYFALAYKYHIIDKNFELKILNECVCIVEYQFDGSSANMYRQYINNPKGFAFWRIHQMNNSINFKQKFKACIHYVSSSIICKNRKFLKESPCKFFTLFCIPFGWVLSKIVKRKAKNSFMIVEGMNR